MEHLKIIGYSGALFLVIILCLAVPPKYSKKALGWIAVSTVIAALFIYGYGYADLHITSPNQFSIYTNILRTVFDASRIFVGASDWDTIKAAYNEAPAVEFIFWIIHLLAMTTSASAIIISLGSRLLKKIRMWVFRMQDITLIFGLNENTLEFGRELVKKDKAAILYIDQSERSQLHSAVEQMGALVRSDTDALSGNIRFLRSIGLRKGKRKLRVYALDRTMLANQQYARKLLTALEKRGILPEQTSLTILSINEETDNPMQACPDRYGYGSLISINEPEMAARMLIRSYPPYQSVAFDENGRAVKDFHAVIVGFGQTGQAVLRQFVMNSQFYGGTSTIAVFAPDYEKRMGWICHECQAMLDHYNFSLYPYDGRSRQLYDYLESHASTINYVAICAGSETVNLEIGERFQPFLQRRGCDAPILMCSSRGVSHLSSAEHIVSYRIYTPELLCTDQIDRMAMVLNQSYRQGGDMLENWRSCSYFDRMSSRAAADFYAALLHCAGTTPEEALQHWNPEGALLENLAATEHLRWNAFHYCMGFRPMTQQEFRERADQYLAEKAKDPDTEYRITKDMDKRLHACMIPWEELDTYSAKENAITDGCKDYAENDRNNVRDIAKVLRAMKSDV